MIISKHRNIAHGNFFNLGITVKVVTRGTVNSNNNNIVYKSTESSYESPFKDLDFNHESWRHHFNTTAAGKAPSFIERKVVSQTCCWDIVLKTKMDTICDDPKSNCFEKWLEKELVNDLIFLPSGNTKWHFFHQSYVTVGHWSTVEEKCAKMQK